MENSFKLFLTIILASHFFIIENVYAFNTEKIYVYNEENLDFGYDPSLYIHSIIASSIEKWPISLDNNMLLTNKRLYLSGDEKLVRGVSGLVQLADEAMGKKVGSVIEKGYIAGIKDINNYLSMGPYWWPDPNKEDGLPYIRKDGHTNPEVRKIMDKSYLNRLSETIDLLGLAYFYTEEEKYAKDAVERLRVWFINEQTKMNPNLNNGQYIPGRYEGRPEGIIDTRVLIPILNGIQMIKNSSSWTPEIENEINEWFSKFLDWLLYSPIGKSASTLKNNIGTAYQLQVIGISIFLDKPSIARESFNTSIPQLLNQQFDANGVQVLELKRADSWSYSVMNLSYWFSMAQMLENIGIDLWNYRSNSGRSLVTSFEWMMSYALGDRKWEYPQKRKVDYNGSFSRLYQISKGKFINEVRIFGIQLLRISQDYQNYESLERISNKPLDIIQRQN